MLSWNWKYLTRLMAIGNMGWRDCFVQGERSLFPFRKYVENTHVVIKICTSNAWHAGQNEGGVSNKATHRHWLDSNVFIEYIQRQMNNNVIPSCVIGWRYKMGFYWNSFRSRDHHNTRAALTTRWFIREWENLNYSRSNASASRNEMWAAEVQIAKRLDAYDWHIYYFTACLWWCI